MPKRLVLVHDCGYVVKEGDRLTVSTHPGRRLAHDLINKEWVYLAAAKSGEWAAHYPPLTDGGIVKVAQVDPTTGVAFGAPRSFYALCFDCTVMEIDDDG